MTKRWRRRISASLMVLALLVAFHATLLQWLGSMLVVSNAPDRPGAVLLMNGDGLFNVAARYAHADPNVVFLKCRFEASRLEKMGLWADRTAEFHRELQQRGIADDHRVVLDGVARTEWEAAGFLGNWLRDHPGENVAVLCDEFQSRRVQRVLKSALGAEANRIGLRPLTDRRFNVQNWWKSRPGIRQVVLSAISLTTTLFHTNTQPAPVSWDPDVYEAGLKKLPLAGEKSTPSSGGWLAGFGHWLDIGQTPRKVDHVVLLPGDENVRPFAAAALVKAGLASDILVPRNFASPAVEDGLALPTDEIIAAVIASRGVPSEQLRILEMRSDGTIDDARATAELLNQEPHATVAVVTSFFHTRRARMSFRAVFGSRADSFVYVSTPVTGYTADDWWLSDAGTQTVVTEYVKLLIYWVSYGPGLYWLVGGGLFGAVLLLLLKRRRRCLREQSPGLIYSAR